MPEKSQVNNSMTENIELHINESTNALTLNKGAHVEYLSNGGWVPAKIIDVHHDDAPPYYTIYIPPDATGCGAKMCGRSCMCVCSQIREKQTVRHKLRILSTTSTQTSKESPNKPQKTINTPSLTAPAPTSTIPPPIQAVHHHHIRKFNPQVKHKRMGMVFK